MTCFAQTANSESAPRVVAASWGTCRHDTGDRKSLGQPVKLVGAQDLPGHMAGRLVKVQIDQPGLELRGPEAAAEPVGVVRPQQEIRRLVRGDDPAGDL